MSYEVFVHKFEHGDPVGAPFKEVASVLEKYGSVDFVEQRIEFEPFTDDICEIGFLGGSEADGIDSIGFERPVSGGRLRSLIFELLSINGMCFFELDVSYVLARTDVTEHLPEGLRDLCDEHRVTVISNEFDVPL
jgi:hypothetical protein